MEVGLQDQYRTTASALSGGQKRKLCIAMAFMGSPQVVFLDEPTSGMDPYSRRSAWELLRKKRQGRVLVRSAGEGWGGGRFSPSSRCAGIDDPFHGRSRCVGAGVLQVAGIISPCVVVVVRAQTCWGIASALWRLVVCAVSAALCS